MGDLTFRKVRETNVKRCNRWHPEGINSWSLSDWGVALGGEVGEIQDVIKKLNRVRDGLVGNRGLTKEDLLVEFKKEIADSFLYLDLLAAAGGVDLEEAVVEKFNEVSDRVGFPEKL